MSSITNIPINTRSMNGVITISDGVATMEDGNLTGLDTLQTNTLNSITLTTSTPPSGSNDDTVPNTNWVYTNYAGLTNGNTFSGSNTFTGSNTYNNPNEFNGSANFNTVNYDEIILTINILGSPNQTITLCPKSSGWFI